MRAIVIVERHLLSALATLLVACTSSSPPRPASQSAPAVAARPAGRSAPETFAARGHVMKYTVSLPAGWTPDRAWPVVIVIPDAARDFAGNLAEFATAGAATPYIFVAPHVVTSGGSRGYRDAPGFRYTAAEWREVDRLGDFRFDEEGVAATIADVRERFHGDDRVYLTGWEAGGHTVWALLLRHPEQFRAVAPVSTNFQGRWLDADQPVARPAVMPEVRVLFCGGECFPADVRGHLMTQTQEAIALARSRGFGEIAIDVREGTRHGPLAADVLAWFAAVSAAEAVRR